MSFKPVVLGLLAAGCVTAAAGGAFVAVRQSSPPAAVAEPTTTESAATPFTEQPVTETEEVLPPLSAAAPQPAERPVAPLAERPAPSVATPGPSSSPVAPPPATASRTPRRPAPRVPPVPEPHVSARSGGGTTPPARGAATSRTDEGSVRTPTTPAPRDANFPPAPSATESVTAEPSPVAEAPARAVEPRFVEVVIPSSAVIGLQVDRSLSSETARVEDKVEARVTRDVMAGGRRAIPAGSRMVGSVVFVDQGGKMKGAARLGVRFNTVLLADGSQVPLRTETIYRDGQSPGNESSRKIGGAAVGGAILGAILGGGKGAILGGATGAAGGTAVVMAGERNAATLPAGTIVTAHVSGPVTLQVERE